MARSVRDCGGRKVTRSAMPSSSASRTSPSGEDRPLPDGPPATTTRTPGNFAAARNTMSGAFSGWIRPTNATTSSSGDSLSAARAARRSPGWNTSRSTPGWTTSIRVGSARWMSDQLFRFVLGVDDQPVRLVDHLLLPDRAQRRLGRIAVGQRGVLHRGERVRGVHQRDRPAVAGQPADLPGQPVVRVHDVVVPRFVGRLGAQHPGRERAQLGGQVVLVQALERARHHVADQHAGYHLLHRWSRRRRWPG